MEGRVKVASNDLVRVAGRIQVEFIKNALIFVHLGQFALKRLKNLNTADRLSGHIDVPNFAGQEVP
jgi:hypothetical protein